VREIIFLYFTETGGGMTSRMGEAMRDWSRRIDAEVIAELSSIKQGIAVMAFFWIVLPLLDFWTGFHRYFDLDLDRARIGILPFVVVNVAFNVYHWRTKQIEFVGFASLLLGSYYLQFFVALLVMSSSALAAPAVSALLMLTLLVHGQVLRYTLSPPLGPLASATAIAAAVPFSPSDSHTAVTVFAGISGVIGGTLLGQAMREADAARHEKANLSQALHSQEILRAEDKIDAISSVVVKLFGNFHDVRNVLMATKLNAECLMQEVEREDMRTDELRDISKDVLDALTRLEETTEEVRALAKHEGSNLAIKRAESSEGADGEFLPFLPSIEAARATVGVRYRDRRMNVSIRDDDRGVRVRCVGGEATLRRVFENILVNAFEGNGREWASRVDINVSWSASVPWVEITVADDGPGFPPHLLDSPIKSFTTTKENGTGVGLFTCDRLVRACGGTLDRDNRTSGGAIVTVRLPREGGFA
jgi:two-component system, NtrC family, C4-dicarboxylate transport sensor histidine kinase DctB